MSILFELSEPFPVEVERQLTKSGVRLTYIPVSEVITRLNKVIGVDRWSYEVLKVERDTLDPDFVVAWVRLSATFDSPTSSFPQTVIRDGIGGQKIKRTKHGDIVDLGDEMKGAVSDALKKAAQHLGVGLYLARSEEALFLEQADDTVEAPISEEHFVKLRGILNSLPTAEIERAKAYWATISDGKGFAQENVTRSLLESLLAFVKQAKADAGTVAETKVDVE